MKLLIKLLLVTVLASAVFVSNNGCKAEDEPGPVAEPEPAPEPQPEPAPKEPESDNPEDGAPADETGGAAEPQATDEQAPAEAEEQPSKRETDTFTGEDYEAPVFPEESAEDDFFEWINN